MSAPDDQTRFHDDFICTCGAERRRARKELVEEVMRRLPDGEDYAPQEVTAARFVSNVIASLDVNYGVTIDQIHHDQWFLIVADKVEFVPGELRLRSAVRVRMQCDDIEGGLAATWKFFADGAEPVERGPFGEAQS